MIGNDRSPILLTGRDLTLLRSLAEVKLLDREQIQQLLDFGSITRVNDRLSRLHAAGLLHRYFLGTRAGGRKALYTISTRGTKTIGREKTWKLQRAEDELLVGEAFVEHQLVVNWCWILMKCGSESNLIRFVRFNEPISASLPLAPDGYVELNISGEVHPIFLEIDLGTETTRVWDRKIELYLKLAVSGEFERIFRQQRFKVAVVCTSARRLESLRRIVRKHTTKLFYFSLIQNIKRDGVCAPHWLRSEGEQRYPLA
ncbi:MAG: replication-relaxation family protein [Terracidiphilus sp.]|jgi:hypothetical protein